METPTQKAETQPSADPTQVEQLTEKLKASSAAAKLSGAFHEQTGKLKQRWGAYRDDPAMQEAGQKQELLGKVHRLVGEVREIRELGVRKLIQRRTDVVAVFRDHAGRFLDGGAAFLEDVKKKLI